MRIAIIDDNQALVELVSLWLEEAGHTVVTFHQSQLFIQACKTETFDVILLDWVMPDMDGEQVLKTLQELPGWDTPVIFVTARSREEDIVHILELGADDYVTKPIQRGELLARIGAVTRRAHKGSSSKDLDLGAYKIDAAARTVFFNNNPVKLTEMEFNLVCFIFNNVDVLLSRNHILSSVWGYDSDMNTRTVDTHISRIRKKLDITPENGWRLMSIYQKGYRLEQINPENMTVLAK
ncbi:MAG: response regulator transcription factor [Gammaproteobacteria bacterium]|nr:response regulator transcription factor [Gammaproteobacteria bacterium]